MTMAATETMVTSVALRWLNLAYRRTGAQTISDLKYVHTYMDEDCTILRLLCVLFICLSANDEQISTHSLSHL